MRISDQIFERVETNKKKIGELLIEHTSLTHEQLEEALELQKDEKKLLGEILLSKNFIHPHEIIKVMCHQVNIPFLNELVVEDIDPNLVKDIAINYAKHHEILPILETESTLTLAMSDPFNFNAINDITGIFKKEIQVVVTTPLKIQDAVNRIYEKANRNMVDSIEDEFEENLDLDGPIDILDASEDDAPVIRFVNSIIFRAVKERASDIRKRNYISF